MAQTSTSPEGTSERLCAEFGYRYIHSGNEPDLIAGVGTYAVEIIEDLPDVEVIFVPVGGGSGACGTAIAAKTINPGHSGHRRRSGQGPCRLSVVEEREAG